MPALRFYQTDVFTTTPLAGNPLAVFPEAAGVSDAAMQALAREMNLSETTFVLPSDRATRRVRIFTPAAEIPLAGHPTIGTWWVLTEQGYVHLGDEGIRRVTQETGRGVLPVDIVLENGRPRRVEMVQTLPEFTPTVCDHAALGTALGGDGDLVLTDPAPRVVSTALPQLMVPVASLAALQALPSGGTGPRLAALLRDLGTDCAMCYTFETASPDATVHCRMFAPGFSVPEDPATGSAAGALGAYLVHHGLCRPDATGVARLVVEQGIEIGRPSRIEVAVTVDRAGTITEVRVAGQAVTVIEGEVRL